MGDGLHYFFEQPKGVMCQWPEAPRNSCCLGKNITISATIPPWTIVLWAKKLKSTNLGVEQKHQVSHRTGLAVACSWCEAGVEPGQDQSLFDRSAKSSTVSSKPPHMELPP